MRRLLFALVLIASLGSCGGKQPPPLQITSTALYDANVGYPYSIRLQASGGNPPYQWCLAPNSALPPGLTLSSDGVIVGVPLAEAGGYDGVPKKWNIDVEVTDKGGTCP